MAKSMAPWCAPRTGYLPDAPDCFDGKQHVNTQNSRKQQADVFKGHPKRSGHSGRKELDLSKTCAQLLIRHLENRDDESAKKHLDSCIKELKQTSSKAFVHSVIHCCAKAGCASTALWCALQMSNLGLSPNVVTFNGLIDACAKKGDIDMATQVWELMTNTGVKPNAITYNTMINSCAQGRNAWLAEKWLMAMLDAGLRPCTVSYSTVIAAFSRMCKPEKAEAWFAKMIEADVKPDRVLYNTLIHAFARTGQSEKAEQWLLEMQGQGFLADQKSLSNVIHSCAKSGDWDRLKFWLRMMDQEGFVLDKNVLEMVTQECAQAGVLGVPGSSADSTWSRSQLHPCREMIAATQTKEYLSNEGGLTYAMHNTGLSQRMLNALPQGACNHHESFGIRNPGVSADRFSAPLRVAPSEEPPLPDCPPLPTRLLGKSGALASPVLSYHGAPPTEFSL